MKARVLQIIDGDTIEVEVYTWLDTRITTRVRMRGIDTAEINRAKCQREATLGAQALDFVTDLVMQETADNHIMVAWITPDKYAGRVLANALTMDGQDIGQSLLDAGLAQEYAGGTRPNWCAT